eukprot:s492_g13.t2
MVQASSGAFAAIHADGSVVTWGHEYYGGDSSKAQEQLRHVRRVQATQCAFAAIRADETVVSWGHPQKGGNSSHVQDKLVRVQHIQATCSAFAAVLADGSVVSWGDPQYGGSEVESTAAEPVLDHLDPSPGTLDTILGWIRCKLRRWW